MKSKPPEPKEVAAWLAKADGDARMADAAMGMDDPLWDQACFHLQQAVEKSLKGLLVHLGDEVPRTHDLVFLVEKICEAHPDFGRLLESASELSQYAVAARYPGFLGGETSSDAKEARIYALEIIDAVKQILQSDPS
jgi:HEPN domain-containing protein